MKSKPLHCWDCGIPVIKGQPGSFQATPILRQVKFNLTGNSYCESTFCVDCAEQPWTRDRLDEFKSAVDAVSPGFRMYKIVGVEGAKPLTEAIAGVV
jgi:hypothetical protein